jgi:hypothetical protein
MMISHLLISPILVSFSSRSQLSEELIGFLFFLARFTELHRLVISKGVHLKFERPLQPLLKLETIVFENCHFDNNSCDLQASDAVFPDLRRLVLLGCDTEDVAAIASLLPLLDSLECRQMPLEILNHLDLSLATQLRSLRITTGAYDDPDDQTETISTFTDSLARLVNLDEFHFWDEGDNDSVIPAMKAILVVVTRSKMKVVSYRNSYASGRTRQGFDFERSGWMVYKREVGKVLRDRGVEIVSFDDVNTKYNREELGWIKDDEDHGVSHTAVRQSLPRIPYVLSFTSNACKLR